MKKFLYLVILTLVISLFSGCSSQSTGKNNTTFIKDMSKYINEKYSTEIKVTSSHSDVKPGKTCQTIKFTSKELGGKTATAQRNMIDGEFVYTDTYTIIKEYDNIINILNNCVSGISPDCFINLNLYIADSNSINDKNTDAKTLLSDVKNNIRACIYIKSEDNEEVIQQKILSINKALTANSCHINSIYYCILDSKTILDEIKKEDTTYVFSLDSLSRNDKIKTHVKDEYFAYYQKDTGTYNYVKKDQHK